MSAQMMDRAAENAARVEAGYAAFARGDLAAVEQTFDAEVVWHAQRLGVLGGDHRGWAEVVQFFGRTMELTQGTFRIEVRRSSPTTRRRQSSSDQALGAGISGWTTSRSTSCIFGGTRSLRSGSSSATGLRSRPFGPDQRRLNGREALRATLGAPLRANTTCNCPHDVAVVSVTARSDLASGSRRCRGPYHRAHGRPDR